MALEGDQHVISMNQSKDFLTRSTTALNGNKVRNLFKTPIPSLENMSI
jgi:hypothetical protein